MKKIFCVIFLSVVFSNLYAFNLKANNGDYDSKYKEYRKHMKVWYMTVN